MAINWKCSSCSHLCPSTSTLEYCLGFYCWWLKSEHLIGRVFSYYREKMRSFHLPIAHHWWIHLIFSSLNFPRREDCSCVSRSAYLVSIKEMVWHCVLWQHIDVRTLFQFHCKKAENRACFKATAVMNPLCSPGKQPLVVQLQTLSLAWAVFSCYLQPQLCLYIQGFDAEVYSGLHLPSC